jgi:ABC-2 type transport system ATP-binding protein
MDHGKIIEQGVPEELLQKHFGGVIIKLPDKNLTKNINFSCRYTVEDNTAKFQCDEVEQTIEELIKAGISLKGLTIERQNLDDLFLKLAGTSLGV